METEITDNDIKSDELGYYLLDRNGRHIRATNNTGQIGKRERKAKSINGEMHYTCALCEELLPEDCFYRASGSSVFGAPVRSYCIYHEKLITKVGRLADKSEGIKRDRNKTREARYRHNKQLEQNIAKQYSPRNVIEIDPEVIAEMKNHCESLEGTNRDLAAKIGMSEEVLRKVLRKNNPKTNVERDNAEKIYYYYNRFDLLEKMNPVIESDKWSKDNKCCIVCGTISVMHCSKGRCHTCYSREKRGLPPRMSRKQWSFYHLCCTRCQRTDRKHAGKGLCSNCYQWTRAQEKKLNALVN